MCGICGVLKFDGRPDPATVARMTARLRHRGPDDEGAFADGDVALGHRRLSIIDVSAAGRQPLFNEDRTIAAIVNGEFYNHGELRDELEAKGHRFSSKTDSEVLVHLYEEEGVECVSRLWGMFALAVWDARNRRLLLARDRIGKKPLVYARVDGGLAFASELEALLEHPGIVREVDRTALHHYLTYQYVPSPWTMISGVHKLPPAHRLVCDRDGTRVEAYWRPDFSRKPSDPAAFDDLFRDAVKRRLMSDVPLGAFLSGGVDSSAVVATMSEFGPVKTYSIGFEEATHNELPFARLVAKRFGTDHHEEIVRPDAVEILPDLVRRYGEPFADPSAVPTYYVCRMARRHVTVVLNGDGGDETFGGYTRYASLRKRARIRWLARLLRRPRLSRDPRLQYVEIIGYFDNPGKREIYSDAMRSIAADSERLLVSRFEEAGTDDLVDAAMYADTMTYLPDDLMVKVDIASMAHGLEARSPFLDHRVVEFAAGLPIEWKTSKRLLKERFAGRLPPEVLSRPKMGFGVPLADWFRGPLRELARDHLSRDRGYFRLEAVRGLLDDHVAGRADHGYRLWALVVLEAWHRSFIDASRRGG